MKSTAAACAGSARLTGVWRGGRHERRSIVAFVVIGVLAAVLLGYGVLPETAAAQQFSGRAADPLDGSCENVRNVTINWRDGTVSPASSFSTTDDFIDIGGTPIPIKWLNVSGTHTYSIPGDYDLLVNYRTDCLNGSGEPYVFNAVNKPLFRVHAGPDSCPFPGAGQARSWALAAQQDCDEPKRRFSPREKKALAVVKLYATRNGILCGALGAVGAFTPVPHAKLLAAIGFGCGIVYGLSAAEMDYLLDTDPPDPHFKHIAKPSGRHLNRVRPSGGLSRRGTRTLNRLLDGYSRAMSLSQVFRVTIERAGGATVTRDPANVRYERMQMLQAADYAQKLARQLDRVRQLGGPAVRVLRHAGVNVHITRQRAAGFVDQVRRRGLPRRLAHGLKRLGARRSDLRALKRAILGLPAARRAAGRFPEVLAGHSASVALRAEARAMRLFAKRVRAHPTAEPGRP